MEIIKQLQNEGVLVLLHDYRAGHFQDLSGNSRNGTPTTMIFNKNGIRPSATTSAVTVAHDASFNFKKGCIVLYGEFTNQTFSKFIEKSDGTTVEYGFYPSSSSNMAFKYATTVLTYAIDITKKKCLAVNFASSCTPTMWADGVLQGNFSGTCAITFDTDPIYIANDGSLGRACLGNTIGAVLIFNRNLTPTEHAQIYAELAATTWPTKTATKFNLDTDNLLVDGDMEAAGVTAWTVLGNATLTKDTTAPHSGNQALRITYNGTTSPGCSQGVIIAGVNYRIVGWARGDGTRLPTLQIYGGTTINLWVGTSSTTWQYFDVKFTTPPTFVSIGIRNNGGTAGWIEIDDWTLLNSSSKNFKSDFNAKESLAAEGGTIGGFLSNTPFQFGDATARYKISTTTINGQFCKVIECTTGGTLYIPIDKINETATEAAYGTWEFWVYKSGDTNTAYVSFAQDRVADTLNGIGYQFIFNSTESAVLRKTAAGSSSTIMSSASSYISLNTWYKVKITRTTAGVWTCWINDVLLSTTGGSGSNPATENTYTTALYFVLDLDAGDKIAFSDVGGNRSIVKNLGVV